MLNGKSEPLWRVEDNSRQGRETKSRRPPGPGQPQDQVDDHPGGPVHETGMDDKRRQIGAEQGDKERLEESGGKPLDGPEILKGNLALGNPPGGVGNQPTVYGLEGAEIPGVVVVEKKTEGENQQRRKKAGNPLHRRMLERHIRPPMWRPARRAVAAAKVNVAAGMRKGHGPSEPGLASFVPAAPVV